MKTSIIPFFTQADKFIEKAKDCYLFDSEGKQYLDFESGDWAANLGHANEELSCIIENQSKKVIHDGLRFRNKLSEKLSEKLLEKMGLQNGMSVFLNSGSEAVNLGITIARNLTGRKKILKMDCSFLASYGFGQISPDNQNLVNIQIDNILSVSEINFSEIAAFVFEPGNSHGLIRFPSNSFIENIASKVKQNGGMLMANEVTTGFGRTGKWFGFQHYNYNPDIITTGKALGNGYPVSGVSISNEVSELFRKNPFRHAQSHQNDPLGCAVGLGVIKIFEENSIVHHSFENGRYFLDNLVNLKNKYPGKVKEIRGRGLMTAIELENSIKAEVIDLKLIEKGFVVGIKGNTLRFMPPLIIARNEIDRLIITIDHILSELDF